MLEGVESLWESPSMKRHRRQVSRRAWRGCEKALTVEGLTMSQVGFWHDKKGFSSCHCVCKSCMIYKIWVKEIKNKRNGRRTVYTPPLGYSDSLCVVWQCGIVGSCSWLSSSASSLASPAAAAAVVVSIGIGSQARSAVRWGGRRARLVSRYNENERNCEHTLYARPLVVVM